MTFRSLTRHIARATLVLAACLTSTLHAAEPLKVGVATTEITPPLGYPMAGYFNERGAEGVLDPLNAKAIVFEQGDSKAALVVCDIISVPRELGDAIREKVEAETGIPATNVTISATHTHTGPRLGAELTKYLDRAKAGTLKEGEPLPYIPKLIDAVAGVIKQAHDSAKPAGLEVAEGIEDTTAFNRRFLLKDGTVRTWARLDQPDVVKAAGPTDPTVGILAVTREGQENPEAAIVNFSLHCDTVAGTHKTHYSADYPGHIARVLTAEFGPQFVSIFATAPCGDINHNDPTGKVRRIAPEIGEIIGKAAAKAFPESKPIVPDLGVKQATLDIPLQDFTAEDLAWAKDVVQRRAKGESFPTPLAARAGRIMRLNGLKSSQGNTDSAKTGSLLGEVQVIRLSKDVAIVTLPGEVFVELGLDIKKASPFKHTFVIELCNDSPAYVPTRKAMAQGSYEVENSLYAAGGGEMLVEKAIELLKELAPNQSATR